MDVRRFSPARESVDQTADPEEHIFEDGVCLSCSDDLPDGPLDEDTQALLAAISELAHGFRAKFDAAVHPRNPKGSPGGGRFRSNVDRLKDALKAHKTGKGDGDPFEGFNREQLRRVAKARGIELKRGEGRDSIASKLKAHLSVSNAAKDAPSKASTLDEKTLSEGARNNHESAALAAERLADSWKVDDADLEELAREDGIWTHISHLSPKERRQHYAESLILRSQGESGGPEITAALTAVVDKLGGKYELDGGRGRINQFIRGNPAMERATRSLGEAVYRQTQDWFKERGITHVRAYRSTRGLDFDAKQPYTSWSTGKGTVRLDGDRELRDEVIPVERIAAIPTTGFGSIDELELIVLNESVKPDGHHDGPGPAGKPEPKLAAQATASAAKSEREVRKYNANQKRDPNGEWGDGLPGPGMPDLDLGDFDLVSRAEGTFGTLEMGVNEADDVRIAFHQGNAARHLDLDAGEVEDLRGLLDQMAGTRDSMPDNADPGELYDEDRFGYDDAHKVELYGNGIISIVFGADEPDPYTLTLDPPYEADPGDPDDEDYDDVQSVGDAIGEVLDELDARERAAAPPGEARRFDPAQKRDPNGEWGDGLPGASALKDALKLAGRIDLAADENLLGSGKVDAGAGGIRMALTERGGHRMLRFGAGGQGYGQRNRDEGVAAWDGNPSHPPLTPARRERLSAESDALDDEYESASPDRQEQITARRDEILEQLTADDQGFNGTANLDEYSMRRLADRIRPAMAEAVEQEKAQNKAWDELEALEANGGADPARLAKLRETARLGATDFLTFASGIIPGSEWGDVHFSVELDDPAVGPYLMLGVQPKGASDDWGDDKDWQGQFDAAETRKFLRLLDTYIDSGAASRHHDFGEAQVSERYNDQHAPAGSSTGGQFTAGGGGGETKKPAAKPTPKQSGGGRRPARRPAAHGDSGDLSYDPKSNHGTGYDSRDGDERVHALQQALNRLGVKDSARKALKDDGKLGPKTTSAVKALQRRLGLEPDGKVTSALLTQIKSMKALPAAKSMKKRSVTVDYCVRSFGFEFEERGTRNSDGRTLEGYAAVFNSPTRIAAIGGDFDEVISPGAFTRSIRSRMPVLQFEHGRDPRVGAVPIGAIQDLAEDSRGLHVRATLFDNPVVEPVRQAIAGQAIKGMSFRFNVVDGGDQWTRRSGDIDLRAVGDADVHELGPVVFPAYDQTTVSVRSLLAQLGRDEHLTLLRELAHDLRSVDPKDFTVDLDARSAGGGDDGYEPSSGHERTQSPDELRLQERALRALGVLQ